MTKLKTPNPKKNKPITESKREAVYRYYGRRCHYPKCKMAITQKNYLVIHDTTHTGQHTCTTYLRPLCMTHHNVVTNLHRAAKAKLEKFRARGIKIGETQPLLFEEEFYGQAK